jgi:hypothetical protein
MFNHLIDFFACCISFQLLNDVSTTSLLLVRYCLCLHWFYILLSLIIEIGLLASLPLALTRCWLCIV